MAGIIRSADWPSIFNIYDIFELMAASPNHPHVAYADTTTNELVAAGETHVSTFTLNPGQTSMWVRHHLMDVSVHRPNIYITHQQDNYPPVNPRRPMMSPFVIPGYFLPVVTTKVTHTVENDSDTDVYFMDDIQALTVDIGYYREVLAPLLRAGVRDLEAFARQELLKLSGGSAT